MDESLFAQTTLENYLAPFITFYNWRFLVCIEFNDRKNIAKRKRKGATMGGSNKEKGRTCTVNKPNF
jgi:hypothetical protein